MRVVIGVDVGGTFTDGIAVDLDSGSVFAGKSPTTYPDPLPGVKATLTELGERAGTTAEELLASAVKFVHGTTLTSNVMFERNGAKLGLVSTEGFGDTILMMSGKGRVAGLSLMERRHFRKTDKPEPIVPRERVVEISERIDSEGDVVVPLTEERIEEVLDQLESRGVEACAVALMWSFRNPEHERKIGAAIQKRWPDMFVTLSSDVAPLIGEYERTATAAVNAYVGPAVRAYLATVEQSLRDLGLTCPLLILQASGGVAEASETEPVHTIESGPAAGVRGAVRMMGEIGENNVIVTDVGGTTFKATIVSDGEAELTTETVVNQYSLAIPMIDVISIGAGGGSIAWADGARLQVGPRSAGSEPGPACYGRGGTSPTVTDADLVLGYLNADNFLGGRMKLDRAAAEKAILDGVGDLFDGDVIRAAAGIREVIDTQMADLIRKASVERGHDPQSFTLLACGGAGPVHCGAYGSELGSTKLVVPINATVYSALGAAVSDIQHSFQVSRSIMAPGDLEAIQADYAELEEKAMAKLRREDVDPEAITMTRWAGIRFRRQFHELRIPVYKEDLESEQGLAAIVDRFQEAYTNRYGAGAGHGSERVEFSRFGVEAVGSTPQPNLSPAEDATSDAEQALRGSRPVWWRETEELTDTAIYDGTKLGRGATLKGPAVIEHLGTSIAVHPGQTASVDGFGNTIIEIEEAASGASRSSRL